MATVIVDSAGSDPIESIRLNGGGTEKVTIKSSGSVGVGTTTPAGLVEIQNAVAATVGDTNYWLRLSGGCGFTGDVDQIGMGYASTNSPVTIGARTITQTGNTTAAFFIATRNTTGATDVPSERLTVDPAGKVGIGQTSPGGQLHVKCDGSSTDQLRLENSHTSGKVWIISDGVDTSGTLSIRDSTAGATRLVIDTNGNVGIGTTSPGAALHIESSGGTTDQLRLQNSYTGGKTWTLSVGHDVASNLSIRNVDASLTIADFHYDSTGNSTLTFRVGSYNLPAANSIEAIGVGQVTLLGTDASNYSDAMALVVTHGGFSAPNNGASAKLDITFRNNANSGRFEGGYVNFAKVNGSDAATLALATYNGTSVNVGIFMDQNQNLGLNGNTSPTHAIDAAGGANLSGGVWNNGSSREYKKDICPLGLDQAVDALMELNPVKYRLKTDESEKHVGFIAEDVPELVANKDRKSLSPMDIVAVLTKVVQAQQKKLDELTMRIA